MARNRRSPSASPVDDHEYNISRRRERIKCANPISQGIACDATRQEKENSVRLNDSSNTLKLSLPAKHHCTNVALQIGAVIVAVTFGAFAVQAVRLSNHANHYAALAVNQSIAQNQMAMYAICISLQLQIQSVCLWALTPSHSKFIGRELKINRMLHCPPFATKSLLRVRMSSEVLQTPCLRTPKLVSRLSSSPRLRHYLLRRLRL